MQNSSKIKLILLIFFIIFFGLLFWYFYQPTNSGEEKQRDDNTSDFNLFPFGDGTKPEDKKSEGEGSSFTGNSKVRKDTLPKLRQISKIPTAGVIFDALSKQELHKINVENDIFDTKDAWTFDEHISEIRYVAKRDGNIYSTFSNTKNEKRVSNTTIQKVYDAEFWDKNNLLVRYLDNETNIKSYSIKLQEKTSEELEEEKNKRGDKKLKINTGILKFGGVFFPTNIEDMTLLKNPKKIFYLRKEGRKTIGVTAGSFAENKKQIFESELNEWNINWKNPNDILLNSKSSSETYTLSFKLNPINGSQKKISEAILAGNGLPNNSFTKILYSGKDFNQKFHLYVYDIKKDELSDLRIETLVEKCVWSKNNIDVYCGVPNGGVKSDEPDQWYKGYTDFSDSIYKINTRDNSSELIFDSYSESKRFDISKIYLDDFEDYVYFIDSMTDFAWSYELPKEEKDVVVLDDEFTGVLGGGNVCPANLTITENLRSGDRNGKYSSWAKKTITEAKILQKQMNRLGFNAGEIDGILGKNSDASIKRMQKYLGTYQDGLVGPITRSLLNNSCD